MRPKGSFESDPKASNGPRESYLMSQRVPYHTHTSGRQLSSTSFHHPKTFSPGLAVSVAK